MAYYSSFRQKAHKPQNPLIIKVFLYF